MLAPACPDPASPAARSPATARPLLLLLAALLLGALFVAVLLWVVSGQSASFDLALIRALHPPPGPLSTLLLDFVGFWGTPGDYLVCALAAWHMLRVRRLDALVLAGCLLGAELQLNLIKLAVGRPRPALFPELGHFATLSFPSGHALSSVAFYGLLGFLLGEELTPGWRRALLRVLLLAGALVIGLSRTVQGEHWPSDVLAGFLYGGAWLCVCLAVLSWLRRRPARGQATRSA